MGADAPRQYSGEATPAITLQQDEDCLSPTAYFDQPIGRPRAPSLESGPLTGRLTATTIASHSTPPSSIHSTLMDGLESKTTAPQAVSSDDQGFGQPETTIVQLISTSATASAFPESFGLSISQRGRWIAAYTSTALHILNSQRLPEVQGRFFKVRRKPLALAISDEPQTLAILSNPHNVDVYSKSPGEGDQETGDWQNLKQRSIIFGHEITSVALSPDAKILAAGYRGGVEIVACGLDASDNQRRQVSCEPMAEVAFSYDGRTLLATSTTKKTRPSTIISVGNGLDGPMSDEGIMESLPPEKAWISQLLFPERATLARQAAMLPDNDGVVGELFAFNAEEERWGLYDVNLKRFTEKKLDVLNLAPRTHKMQYEATLPAVSPDSAQVALCTKHTGRSDVLIYHIPFAWRDGSTSPTSPVETQELPPTYGIPLTKTEDASPESITSLRWICYGRKDQQSKRLVALATSLAHPVDEDVDAVPPAASGRIIVIDTDKFRPTSSPKKVTINFDELPQEALGDEHMDFEREVSLIRSRTQAIRRRSSAHSNASRRMTRSSTSLGHRAGFNALLSPSDVSESSLTRRHSLSSITSDDTENSFGALVLPMEEPYSQQGPRSNFSLQRAATISAQSGASRRHLLALPDRPLEFRRADGSRGQFEIPHESDADNWVPPPPPYSRDLDTTHSQPVPGLQQAPLPMLNTNLPTVHSAQTSPISITSPAEQTGPLLARSVPTLMPARRPVPASATVYPSASNHPAVGAAHHTLSQRQTSGSLSLSHIQHPSALVPGPYSSAHQNHYPQPQVAQPRPESPRLFTTTTAPRSASHRSLLLPLATQSQPHFSQPPPDPSPVSNAPRMEYQSPIEQHSAFPAANTSPQTTRRSQRITSEDLSRPLPPLPQNGHPPQPNQPLHHPHTSNGGFGQNIGRRTPTSGAYPSGPESKGKKKGTKCVVM